MLTFMPEPTDERARPLFRDAESCSQWLGQFQMTNMQLAHSQLLTQIDELNRYPMHGLERLNTLELLRETVAYVQDNYARKIIGKPLPLCETELMVLIALVQLWQVMAHGYQRCLQDYAGGDKQLAKQGALLCQRCLVYSGLGIFTYLRSGYEFEAKLWNQLHELYAFAEERNLYGIEVSDPLNHTQPSVSCRCVYVKILLACYARPTELNRSQLQMLDIWLTQWSDTVTIERNYTINSGDAPPLALDLARAHGLLPVSYVRHHSTVRYLIMAPLGKLLCEKLNQVQEQSLLQPSLCEHCGEHDCTRHDCIELLNYLRQCLCHNPGTRFSQRRPFTQYAQLCCKLEGIYAHLSGKLFQQPRQDNSLDETARKQIEVFGRVLDSAITNGPLDVIYPLEMWQFDNESISGASLTRDGADGARFSNKQLIALRPGDAKIFMLGATVWTHMTRAGKLRIGIRYIPGTAEAVSVKISGFNKNTQANYVPAFIMAAVELLNSPASLIVQCDWLQMASVVEILHQNGEKKYVKTGFIVERGIDYERVSFTPLNIPR